VKQREAVPPLMDGLTQKFEIVGLVRFLLSDATKYITGQTYFCARPNSARCHKIRGSCS
jgi:hypothetical protein